MSAELSQAVEALTREVRYLRDRMDIRDCIERYPRGIDRMDFEIIRSIFHEDAIDEHGVVVSTVDGFVEYLQGIRENFRIRLHNITTHNCDLDGDVAHCESYVLFGLAGEQGKDSVLGGGRYVDRLERRSGVWRIAHRRTMVDWLFRTDNSLFFSAEAQAWGYPEGRLDRSDDSYQRPLRLSPDVQARFASHIAARK